MAWAAFDKHGNIKLDSYICDKIKGIVKFIQIYFEIAEKKNRSDGA